MAMQPSNFGGAGDGVTVSGDQGPGVTGPTAICHTITDMVGNEESGF